MTRAGPHLKLRPLATRAASADAQNFRALDVTAIPPVAPGKTGAPPKMEWINLKSLVIDEAYQRDLSAGGIRNIRNIAENFDWTSFGVVVVAASGKPGLWSIIDGQHRCHAALLIGLERVPCLIVDANKAAQARAFDRINSNVTRVHPCARFAALVSAGDPDCVDIAAMHRDAGVKFLRYALMASKMKARETNVAYPLGKWAQQHGRDVVVLALRCVVETATSGSISPENAGLLKMEIIGPIVTCLAERMHWGEAALLDAFRSFDLSYVRVAGGGGQHSRMNLVAAEIGRRLDRWRVLHPAAVAAAPAQGAASETKATEPRLTETRRGVTLARVAGVGVTGVGGRL